MIMYKEPIVTTQAHRPFEKGLEGLKRKLVEMANIAEAMIDAAIAELVQRDEGLVEKVPELEQQLNGLQMEVDELALQILATQQPVARDLRFVVAATKINSDLERIGDLTINVTHNAETVVEQEPLKPLVDIPRMGELAKRMVVEAIEAFVNGDALAAQRVIMVDDQVDALKDQTLRVLLTYMIGDPKTIERGLALILIARHLERIADHAVNIAQDVIYMTQGRDVRHPQKAQKKPAK